MKKVKVAMQKKKAGEVDRDVDVLTVTPEYTDKLKDFVANQILEVSIDGEIKPRSLQQLALYWVLCKKVADNTSVPTAKDVSEYVKLRCHYVDTLYGFKGAIHYRTKSISFKEMKHKAFTVFMDSAKIVLAEMLGVTEESLVNSQHDM